MWSGDQENFRKLAEINGREIAKTGAKTIVTSCAECARTLKLDYPEAIDGFKTKVVHLAEFLAAKLKGGELDLGRLEKKITYQDSCRLGRHLGKYEEPRKVMGSVPGVELVEMPRNRKNALCCGTCGWLDCDAFSQQMQVERLRSAKETGAETLITSCPKCAIHFRCTLSANQGAEDARIDISDFSELVAETLNKESKEST